MPHRPAFDPSRIRRRPAARGQPADHDASTFSVRQVNEMVRGALARDLPPTLHVLGELGNISRPTSGHVYFTLKDPGNELRCVMWRSAAARLKFEPEIGMELIATGGIEVYAQRGAYQLIVRKLEPRGVGALEIAFRQLKQRLEREGLFDPQRKRPLPRIPERVAVVTSPSGAAVCDILHTLARRFPALDILVFPVRVQGEGAASEIAAAIRAANRYRQDLGGIDVLIVGRGGGSLEDLWAFNEEELARAIAVSKIPVVSAVGHEVDISISDLVADVRAPTPTAAAEIITPTLSELVESLDRQAACADRQVRHTLELARAQLDLTLAYDGLARPLGRINEQVQFVDELLGRLGTSLADLHRRARERLGAVQVGLLRYGAGARLAKASQLLETRLHKLSRALGARTLTVERHLTHSVTRLERNSPVLVLPLWRERLEQAEGRARRSAHGTVVQCRRLLDSRAQAVGVCDPKRVLRRGYSVTRDARTRRVIRSVSQIRDRMRIITEVANGEFRATADDPKQPSLFD